MRSRNVVCGLVVIALMAGASPQAMAQIFPWWSFDSVLEEIQDRGTIRVGLGLFEPWSLCNADGELIGMEIDVATKLAKDMGVEVEFVRTNWSYVISSLIAEDFDAIISGMTMLPSRNLRVNFSSPYNFTGVYLVANAENTADLESLDDFNSSEVTIAARRGSSAIPAIENVFPDAMILLFDSASEVLAAVVAGDADAAAAFATTRTTWVEAHPDTLRLVSEESFAAEALGMAVRKGDLDILNFLNSWIAVNEANGWLEQRRQYWFVGREWEDRKATDPDTIAACEASFL